mgnify:CR=1 FL=1
MTIKPRVGILHHLISISGLHVTLFATVFGGAVYWSWRRSHRLTTWLPARKAAALLGVLAAFGYVLLAGFEVPAQRTLYMLAVAALGLWIGRPGTAALRLCQVQYEPSGASIRVKPVVVVKCCTTVPSGSESVERVASVGLASAQSCGDKPSGRAASQLVAGAASTGTVLSMLRTLVAGTDRRRADSSS